VPTSICAMRSNSSTNVWLRCVQVDDDDDDARTPPPTPEAAGTTAGGDVVAVRETPVAADGGVKGGSSGSKSNIGRSRSKSTSNDDSDDNDDDGDGDVVDDDVVAAEAVDGQTVAESRSNSDENVKIGGGDKGNADVRSQPNRSSRMDDVVASSSAERTESPKCSPKSAGRDGVASRRSEPSSRAPGRSSRTRQGVDGGATAAETHIVVSAAASASTARSVLRMSTERRSDGSRRRSDRVSGAAVRTLARLSSTTRCLSCSRSSSTLQVDESVFSSSSDNDDVLFRFSWFDVTTSHMTPVRHRHITTVLSQRLTQLTMSACPVAHFRLMSAHSTTLYRNHHNHRTSPLSFIIYCCSLQITVQP